jgi:seryl-tRNA synthetase
VWNNLAVTNGQKSYAFKNSLARLEWALVRHTVDHLVNQCGFTLVAVPDVIPARVVQGCGFPVDGDRTQVLILLNILHTVLTSYKRNAISVL